MKLERSLGPVMLWGLGVGYVIAGMFFGWNLGLEHSGTLGLAIATVLAAIMYITFTFGYAELACALPKAGGAFTYSQRAFGPLGGFVGGFAQIIEFVFAPPAIAAAIGAYVQIFVPQVSVLTIAIIAYLAFTLLNIVGVKMAAVLELWVTVISVAGLLLFAGVALPEIQWENLTNNALPNGWTGVFTAFPFAIWFFLAIEGIANVAEETINPQVNVVRGFTSAMVTLLPLCFLTFIAAVGVNGSEALARSDSPLPIVLGHLFGGSHMMPQVIALVGLFGLVASFNGIILVAGRATFEFGREGLFPKRLGAVHSRFRTPAWALVANLGFGIAALLTGKTAEIIIIACFGALTLYIISTLALFELRRSEPELERPFKTPGYPFTPAVALTIAGVALISMLVAYPWQAAIYSALLGGSALFFQLSQSVNRRYQILTA
jgi:ethanolamine permease